MPPPSAPIEGRRLGLGRWLCFEFLYLELATSKVLNILSFDGLSIGNGLNGFASITTPHL